MFQAEVAGLLTDDSGNRELEEMHKQASNAIASRQVLFFLASHTHTYTHTHTCVCVCVCVHLRAVCPSACACMVHVYREFCTVRCGAGMAEKRSSRREGGWVCCARTAVLSAAVQQRDY